MANPPPSGYKWYILFLGVATHIFAFALPKFCMPVLFEEMASELNLSLVQEGMIWGIVNLPPVLFSFFWGMLGDQYGTRRTLTLACILVGMTGALRGLPGDYTGLVAFSFLFGLAAAPIAYMTHKAAGQWFSGRQLGLANGILAMGMGVGLTLASLISATLLSPLLGGWRNLMFAYGAVSVVVGLLWFMARRSPVRGEAVHEIETIPLRQSFSHIIHLRQVWLLALVQILVSGCRTGISGYLPTYLRQSGWTPINADSAMAAMNASAVLGVIPLTWLSDRSGHRKTILSTAFLIAAVSTSLLSVLTSQISWSMIMIILAGCVQEGNAALMITMIMETEGVGGAYAGTALGLWTSFAGLGGFVSPPIGNALAEKVYAGSAFIFWGSLLVGAWIMLRFAKETGWKKKQSTP